MTSSRFTTATLIDLIHQMARAGQISQCVFEVELSADTPLALLPLDSLDAVNLFLTIENHTKKKLQPEILGNYPTLGLLAHYLDGEMLASLQTSRLITYQAFKYEERPDMMAQSWRLRYRVFIENLGWEIPSVDLLEMDHLDHHAVHLAAMESGKVIGYLRMLCLSGPTLIGEYFSSLLNKLPNSPEVWEVSRFAVDQNHPDFPAVTLGLLREGMILSKSLQAQRLLAVIEPSFENFLQGCRVPIRRLCDPVIVGSSTHGDVRAMVVESDMPVILDAWGND